MSDPQPTPAENAQRRERTQTVQSALCQLPPTQRLATILRYYEGLGYVGIADALEISPKAAERLLDRARKNLATILIATLGQQEN